MRAIFFLVVAATCAGIIHSGLAAPISTTPIADAFVATGPTGNLTSNNYGGGGALVLAAPGLPNGEFQTVIKFDLSSTLSSLNAQYGVGQWTLQSVVLQLTSSPHGNVIYNPVAAGQFGVSLMQNSSWIEGTGNASSPTQDGITFNTLQSTYITAGDQTLGAFTFPGGTTGANSYSLSLSSGLIADVDSGGIVSLRLFADDNTVSYLLSSRATTPSTDEPQLILTAAAVPEPTAVALLGFGLGTIFLWRKWRIAASAQ